MTTIREALQEHLPSLFAEAVGSSDFINSLYQSLAGHPNLSDQRVSVDDFSMHLRHPVVDSERIQEEEKKIRREAFYVLDSDLGWDFG